MAPAGSCVRVCLVCWRLPVCICECVCVCAFDYVPCQSFMLNSTERGALFRHFCVSKVITTAHAHKSGVIFHIFSRAFKQKKFKALRPKMTKIASGAGGGGGGSCLKFLSTVCMQLGLGIKATPRICTMSISCPISMCLAKRPQVYNRYNVIRYNVIHGYYVILFMVPPSSI